MPDRLEKEVAVREVTRWRGKPALLSAVGFFAFLVGLLVICSALTSSWTTGQFPTRASGSGPRNDPSWNLAPPQLQTNPDGDLAAVRAKEFENLHADRWADTTHAYAIIPIDDAMSLYAQAAASGKSGQLLPAPKPATPIDLQVQKSGEKTPPVQPPEKP